MKIAAYITIFFINILIHFSSLSQNQIKIDSLNNLLKTAKEDTSKVFILLNLSNNYSTNKLDTAILIANNALNISTKLNFLRGMSSSVFSLGGLYWKKKDIESSLNYYLKNLDILGKIGNKTDLAFAHYNVGILYNYQENYEKALEHLIISLRIRESLWGENPSKIAEKGALQASYIMLGTIYKRISEFGKALEYYNKALTIGNSIGERAIANPLMGIGNVYIELGKYDKALETQLKSLAIREKISTPKEIALQSNNIGETYQKLAHDYVETNKLKYDSLLKKSLFYFTKALDIYEKNPRNEIDNQAMVTIRNNIAKTKLSQNEVNKAIEILNNIEPIAKDIKFKSGLQQNYSTLAEAYLSKGDYKQAYQYYKKYSLIKDSLFSKHSRKQINQMIVNYDFEKKESAIQAENDKKLAVAAAESRAMYGYLGFGLLALLSFSLFYRQREKNHHLQEITKTNQEKIDAMQELTNTKVTHHFVSNTYYSINTLIKKNENEKASKYLDTARSLTRTVIENAPKKLVLLSDDLELLSEYVEIEKLRFNGNLFLSVEIDPSIDPETTQIPPMIFQVLSENSIIHGFKKETGGSIKVRIKKDGDKIHCEIEDDGIGRKIAIEQRMNDPNKRLSIGTELIDKLISLMNKKIGYGYYTIIDLVSGTRVVFSLPFSSTV